MFTEEKRAMSKKFQNDLQKNHSICMSVCAVKYFLLNFFTNLH